MSLTITLTDDQLDVVAKRVLELLKADQRPPTDPDLVSVDRAAELAGVAPKTIANWVSGGRLTRHGVPRKPLVSRAELLALLAPASPSEPPRARAAVGRAPAGVFSLEARRSSAGATDRQIGAGGAT